MRLTLVALASTLAVVAAVAVASAATRQPIPGMRSPSGNIRCLYLPRPSSTATLLCSIGRATYAAALQRRCSASPAGLDWHGFELSATRTGEVTCSGGILYDPALDRPVYATLAYGDTWRRGPFSCSSRRAGVTCTNRHGHGLFVSRESWRTY